MKREMKYYLCVDKSFALMPDNLAKDFWEAFYDEFEDANHETVVLDTMGKEEEMLKRILSDVESGHTVHVILHGAPTWFTANMVSMKYTTLQRVKGALIIHVIYHGVVDFFIDTV